MKKAFFFVIFVIFSLNIYAESNYQRVRKLIQDGKLKEAKKLLKVMEKENPHDPDVYITKSNLIISEENLGGGINMITNTDESIYEDAIGYTDGGLISMEDSTVEKSEKLLLKALEYGPKRDDIYAGLCHMYSISHNTDKLIKMLKKMKKVFPDGLRNKYRLTDYALNLKDRGNREDAKEVYKMLISMYPDESDYINDLSWTYMEEGDIDNAVLWGKKCLASKKMDDISASTMIRLFTVACEDKYALKAAKRYSKITNSDYGLSYEGIYRKYKGLKGWKKILEKYLENRKISKGTRELIGIILEDSDFSNLEAIGIEDIDTDIFLLINRIYAEKNPENFDANFNFASHMTYRKNYKKAIETFRSMDKNIKMKQKQRSEMAMTYAWALQAGDKYEEADKEWKALADDKDFYVQSAAYYFLGKNAQKKDYKIAEKYFKKISSRAADSKYANLAKSRLHYVADKDFEFAPMVTISEDAMEIHPKDKKKSKN